ncbi:MAG: hypothetical protein IPJ19_05175 [Planctomycetes bacterium]|nr:hypothetical protein [Planctomycetota bacterium]
MPLLAVLATTFLPTLPVQEPAPAKEPWFTTSGSVGLVSNYVFRGLTQTAREPAIQGGFNVGLPQGWYLGTWGSNESWISDASPGTSSSLELDVFGGFKHELCTDWSYDVGFLHYEYPGDYSGFPTEPNTDELYGSIMWKMLMLKVSTSLGDTFGVDNSAGTWYADLSASFEISEALTLGLHAGHQEYTGSNGGNSNDSLFSYSDYSATLTHPLGNDFSLGFTYSHANTKDAGYTILGDNIGESQTFFSLSKSF